MPSATATDIGALEIGTLEITALEVGQQEPILDPSTPMGTASLALVTPPGETKPDEHPGPSELVLISHTSPAVSLSEASTHLTEQARAEAGRNAEQRELIALRTCLDEAQTALAIQRATAEQSRRAADCARHMMQVLVRAIAQPCLVLNREGEVITWNAALAARTRLSPTSIEGTPLVEHLLPRARRPLQKHIEAAFLHNLRQCEPAILEGPLALLPRLRARRVTLLPLHRIPGSPEALLVLLEPETSARDL